MDDVIKKIIRYLIMLFIIVFLSLALSDILHRISYLEDEIRQLKNTINERANQSLKADG